MTQTMPTRNDLLQILENLCLGNLSRNEVSKWAISIINSENIRITDDVVWKVLEGLGAADLPAPDRDYLYTIEDFKAWQADLLKN